MLKKLSLRGRLTLLISGLFLLMCTGQMLLNNYHTSQQVSALIRTIQLPGELDINRVPAEIVTIGQANDMLDAAFLKNWVALLLVLLLGALCTYILVGYCLRPLRQLTEHIRKTGVSNLDCPPEISTKVDEVLQLADSFNTLSLRLADAFASQQRFLADAAHELRTPLAVLQTKLDVFSRRRHTVEEYEELLESVTRQTARLTSLSNQLLDLTRKQPHAPETFPLRVLAEEVQCDLADAAAVRNVSLRLDIPADLSVRADYMALYRILFNLMENGIKYNHEGGEVSVHAEKDGSHWRFTVADTGCGIQEEDYLLLFEPFWRADSSRSRESGGAGLGLPIVKELVGQMEGTISVKPNSLQGTIFHLAFPLYSRN
ncbi:HAMP domain-containing sensor histidine kinase [Agathobaculum massiliense]|uniref:HAMP domain-containing sensor histidine kinase n=1 Tax=Agathobaculum massiliense TaxID=3014267 RepID=UPI000D1E5371|nr:HAMP domain-containing sensor histidine kinase [Agathobaculum massiliense]